MMALFEHEASTELMELTAMTSLEEYYIKLYVGIGLLNEN
jgi:hypothetical protein